MIIYAPDEEKNIPVRYQIGDGETPIYDLPFVATAGEPGANGIGIASITQTTTSTEDDGNNIVTVTLTNGDTSTFTVQNGSKGGKGDPGAPGAAATIEVGSVTTGAAGSSASVTNSGTAQAAKLNFTIPKGEKGDPGDDGIASVTTTGTGNVITGLSYNESTKVLTATKGSPALPNPKALTVGSKTYDGSSAVSITASDLGLSAAMKFIGTSDISIEDGDVTNPITIDGVSTTVSNGNVVIYGAKEFIWNGSKWEEFGNEGNYKVVQSAVSSPSASGTTTAFIDTISQNAQGVITATKKTVASATQSAAGLMSAEDKIKLDGIETGATANTGDITAVTAGAGLTGGATSGAATLAVGAGAGIVVNDDNVALATSGVTAGTYGPSANVTGSNNATMNVPEITVDKYGRITAVTNRVYTAQNTADTDKKTASSNTSSKIFLVGATTQSTSGQTTYSHDTVYVGTDGHLYDTDKLVATQTYVDNATSTIQTQLDGKVPTSRTVNGKALSSNITLSASDVNALPSTTKIPTKTSQLTNDSGYLTNVPDEIYVGDGEMPSDATIQILLDGSDEEEVLKNELKDYIDNNFGALTLDKHTDGLIYLFRNGLPVGNGISITGEVVEGDVFGYVDENNNIVLRGALANGIYTVKYEIEDEDGNVKIIEIGDMELDNKVYYSVTSNLTNCSISNSTKTVVAGGSYTATITANSGYELKSVTVTMGGSPVSVSGGIINIPNVTGDIVITAVAEKTVVTPTNLLPLSVDANGNDYKGDNGEDGYRTGYKLSTSSGTEKQSASYPACVSGYIKIDRYQDTIRIKNIAVSSTATINNIGFYKADKTYIKGIPGVADAMGNDVAADENGVYMFRPQKWLTSTEGSDIGFFRFSCAEITNETIVTINEEIA
jgi:hypothetical protein